MRLNLSDEPVTAELLTESLRKSGSGIIAVTGNSMYPTLQMGWRVHLEPVRGDGMKIGDIAVFRSDRYLTVHRLVWKETDGSAVRLVFRGDYNRTRERIDPADVIGRVIAIEVPGVKRGTERMVAVEPDVLSRFYRLSYALHSLLRPILPVRLLSDPDRRAGRAARAIFRATERTLSIFLPQKR